MTMNHKHKKAFNQEDIKKAVVAIKRLFIAREDIYAKQNDDGTYTSIKAPITDEILTEHLKGDITIGAYTIAYKDDSVKWGCIDIDGEHVENAARKGEIIREKLISYGVHSESILTEESGSLDSYHLWVFFNPRTKTKKVKRFLEAICNEVDKNIEVFPKQETAGVDSPGNLVKLPFGYHRRAKKRSKVIVITARGNVIEGYRALDVIKRCSVPTIKKAKTKEIIGIRPCFEKAIEEKLQLNGEQGHNFRLALVNELIVNNHSDEQIHDVFRIQSDYDYEKTQNNIDYCRTNYGKPWKCETIREKCSSFVSGFCSNCEWTAKEDEEKEKFKRKAYFEKDGRLYLEILTTDEQYKFAYINDQGKVELADAVDDVLPVELPIKIDGDLARNLVLLPDEDIATCRVLEPEELLNRIQSHIKRYCDMLDLDIALCSYYGLFTWFYIKVNTVGYLRFLADTGKGKSRMETVCSGICFYPIFAGGSGSFSGMMRTNERWHGTIVIDEADMRGAKESQMLKYFNLGFEAGKTFILSDKNDPKRQEVFEPFSPKIFGMRDHFRDNATEGRLLSISPHETTRQDIPIILKKEYYEEARKLRNEIARFVLNHWQDVDGENMVSFKGMGIEPRLQQLAMPLSIVFQLWKGGEETFKNYMKNRQKELKKGRARSWEGSMFNLVYDIAIGDEDLSDDFKSFYEEGEVQAITPSMIAKTMNTTTKTATITLQGIGFEVERRYITYHMQGEKDEREEKKKQVRAYVVHDKRTWKEITQRYYYDEDEEEDTDVRIPEVLESKKYIDSVHGTVTSVLTVLKDEGENKTVTDKTGKTLHGAGTKTEDDDDNIRPEALDKNFQTKQNKEARKRLEEES